jgi:hypothetical protein
MRLATVNSTPEGLLLTLRSFQIIASLPLFILPNLSILGYEAGGLVAFLDCGLYAGCVCVSDELVYVEDGEGW